MNTPAEVAPHIFEQHLALQARANVERQHRSGADWFFWIAGLSLINSLMMWLGGGLNFLAGLAITQVMDGIVYSIAEELWLTGNPAVTLVALGLDAFVAGIFVFCGVFARKRYAWSFIIGMIFYALDALLALAFGSYLVFAFHLWALFGLFTGLRALKQLRALPDVAVDLRPNIA